MKLQVLTCNLTYGDSSILHCKHIENEEDYVPLNITSVFSVSDRDICYNVTLLADGDVEGRESFVIFAYTSVGLDATLVTIYDNSST